MEQINKYSYNQIIKLLLHKHIHFISDCDFFDNFDIKCKVNNISLNYNRNEIMFDCILMHNKKHITIGSNMKNLQFEIIQDQN